MIFGHSRGEWPVPRNRKYEDPLGALEVALNALHGHEEWMYGDGFENAVFAYRAYWWGDCTCGYDAKESAWSEANHHRADCYQERVQRELAEANRQIGYRVPEGLLDHFYTDSEEVGPGITCITMTPRTDQAGARDAYRAAEDEIRMKLCAELGLTYPTGCAVHCTCDFTERWAAFAEENGHDPACPIVRPNFLHKPSGLELRWYKYPLRDSYMSRPVTPKEWSMICAECMGSIAGTA